MYIISHEHLSNKCCMSCALAPQINTEICLVDFSIQDTTF